MEDDNLDDLDNLNSMNDDNILNNNFNNQLDLNGLEADENE